MTRVLIVDDDALVRKFLTQIIPWQEEGYTLIGDARDGEEALQMLAQEEANIILADISMPIMSGIDLIRTLKDEGYQGGIVMLTCHDDFEYVKTAMQLGADEYILKNHLDAATLHTAIASAEHAMQSRMQSNAQKHQLEALAQKGLEEERKHALQTILAQPEITMQAQLALLQSANIKLSFAHCYAMLIHFSNPLNPLFFASSQQLAKAHHGIILTLRAQTLALLLDVAATASLSDHLALLSRLCDAIQFAAKLHQMPNVSIGTSDFCIGAGGLATAVRQADAALMASFYRVGVYHHRDGVRFPKDLPQAATQFATLLPRLLQGNAHKLTHEVQATVQAIGNSKPQPQRVIQWLQVCDQAAGLQRTQAEYAEITDLQSITEALLAYVKFLPRSALPPISISHSSSIQQALHYIHMHYQSVCTLGEAADAAGLSPNYFSAQFKQELGIGFVEYITDLRLTHVQTLMQNEGWDTLKSLAMRSGFSDYQHFCKVFKKKTGVSPAQYRQQLTRTS